jgi:hypothetical protein
METSPDYTEPLEFINAQSPVVLTQQQCQYTKSLLESLRARKNEGHFRNEADPTCKEIVTVIKEPWLPRRAGSTTAMIMTFYYLFHYRYAQPLTFALNYGYMDRELMVKLFTQLSILLDTVNSSHQLDLPCSDISRIIQYFTCLLFLDEAATKYRVYYPHINRLELYQSPNLNGKIQRFVSTSFLKFRFPSDGRYGNHDIVIASRDDVAVRATGKGDKVFEFHFVVEEDGEYYVSNSKRKTPHNISL